MIYFLSVVSDILRVIHGLLLPILVLAAAVNSMAHPSIQLNAAEVFSRINVPETPAGGSVVAEEVAENMQRRSTARCRCDNAFYAQSRDI